ncbi:MAG: hypothetical protein QMD46_09760 [Methanomicrobiales archaeon]|nr:hypothetical protein [Methanomicrobiales archaeon]MDI6877376.1 hypothetical protein [Methanomicrobiales archaeon]
MDILGILLGLLLIGFGYSLILPSLFYPGLAVIVLGILTLLGSFITTPSARSWSECEEEEQHMVEDEILFVYDDH